MFERAKSEAAKESKEEGKASAEWRTKRFKNFLPSKGRELRQRGKTDKLDR